MGDVTKRKTGFREGVYEGVWKLSGLRSVVAEKRSLVLGGAGRSSLLVCRRVVTGQN